MNYDMQFNLCFLTCQDEVLLLFRNKAPNQYLWNGVGGHIEIGESPYQSMIREVREETGVNLSKLDFGGILTWNGFEIDPGGLYIFTAEVADKKVVENGEGHLSWHSRQFAFSDPSVVGNIHHFLPPVLAGAGPFHYMFSYHNGRMAGRTIRVIPSWINIHAAYQGPMEVTV